MTQRFKNLAAATVTAGVALISAPAALAADTTCLLYTSPSPRD